MRIAILISGRLTDSIDQYNNFKRFFYVGDADIDIFVSHSKHILPDVLNRFCALYSPVNIIENDEIYPDISMFIKKPETNRHNLMCMHLNRKNLKNMMIEYGKTHEKTYDCVISTRCDLWFNTDYFPYELMCPNRIFIPNGSDWDGINDQFAFGDMSSMSEYLNVYDNIVPMAKRRIIIHPETLLKRHLLEKKCLISRFDLSYIIRRR
jgi:hypothetical protein